jgi:rare lipoprotein A
MGVHDKKSIQKTIKRAHLGIATLMGLTLLGCAAQPLDGGLSASVPETNAALVAATNQINTAAERADSPLTREPSVKALAETRGPRSVLVPIVLEGERMPIEKLSRRLGLQASNKSYFQRGLASWYGRNFHGRRTASGEVFNMYALTAAHPTLPLPSYIRVRNPANRKEVVVRVNDRGPFHGSRILDLSYTAALKLGLLSRTAEVEIKRITQQEIVSGDWRTDKGSPDESPEAPSKLSSSWSPPSAGRVLEVEESPANDSNLQSLLLEGKDAPVPAVRSETRDVLASALLTDVEPPVESKPVSSPIAPTVPVVSLAPARNSAVTQLPSIGTPGFWVQIGVFARRDGGESFQRKVMQKHQWLAPMLTLFSDPSKKFRLQAGPYTTKDEARAAEQKIRENLKLTPLIVERY